MSIFVFQFRMCCILVNIQALKWMCILVLLSGIFHKYHLVPVGLIVLFRLLYVYCFCIYFFYQLLRIVEISKYKYGFFVSSFSDMFCFMHFVFLILVTYIFRIIMFSWSNMVCNRSSAITCFPLLWPFWGVMGILQNVTLIRLVQLHFI